MKSLPVSAVLAIATLGIGGLLWFDAAKNAAPQPRSALDVAALPAPNEIAVVALPLPTPSDATVSLAMVGDILPLWVKDPLRDAGVRAQLQGADIAFANLESPLSTRGKPVPLKFRGGRLMHREYIFGADDSGAQMLDNAGIDVVSLANNHMMDYGATALADTLGSLQKRGIAAAGAGANAAAARPTVVERRGLKVAFVALVSGETLPGSAGFEATAQTAGLMFARDDGTGAPDMATRNRLRDAIETARSRADVVAVSVHWGTEFRAEPNPFQRALAHFAVDAGADFVVGHHPHCLQGVEVYGGKPIFYSLGNFVFHSTLEKSARSGIARLEVTRNGVQSAAFAPVWVWEAHPQAAHPRIAEASNLLRTLSQDLGTASFFAERNGNRELHFDLNSPAPATNTPRIAATPPGTIQSKAKAQPTGDAGEANQDWVEARRIVAGLIVERPYASTRNAFKTRFYFDQIALLRRGAAAKLRAAQTQLGKNGMRIKLWDGYRPPSVQQKMWDKVRDARYVANPARGGSRHNRGCAVDVTLADARGRELQMPTNYDDFSARAHANASAAPAARRNRALLRAAMTNAGFKPLATEWWHFDDSQCAIYPIAEAPQAAKVVAPSALKATDKTMIVGSKTTKIISKTGKFGSKAEFVAAKIEESGANAPFQSAEFPRTHGRLEGCVSPAPITAEFPRTHGRLEGCVSPALISRPHSGFPYAQRFLIADNSANRAPKTAALTVKLKLKRQFTVATGPKSLRASPSGNLIVVNNLYAHCITLMEPGSGKIRRRIEVPGEAVECAFTEGGTKVWVSLYDKNRVVVIDLLQNRIVAQIPTGQIPKVVEVSRDGKWVYAANWSSQSITVMDAVKLRRVKDVKVGNVPRGIAFTRDGRFAYVANMGADTLSKIDVKNGHRVVKTIRVGGNPRHLVLSRDGRKLYISHNAEGVIRKLDTATDKVLSVARVGHQPRTIVLSRDNRLLLVCNYEDNNIGVVDVATMRQISTTPTSVHPVGATVARDGTLWISNYRTNIIMQFEVQRKWVKTVATRATRA